MHNLTGWLDKHVATSTLCVESDCMEVNCVCGENGVPSSLWVCGARVAYRPLCGCVGREWRTVLSVGVCGGVAHRPPFV
jgi:hypothetical protein